MDALFQVVIPCSTRRFEKGGIGWFDQKIASITTAFKERRAPIMKLKNLFDLRLMRLKVLKNCIFTLRKKGHLLVETSK